MEELHLFVGTKIVRAACHEIHEGAKENYHKPEEKKPKQNKTVQPIMAMAAARKTTTPTQTSTTTTIT